MWIRTVGVAIAITFAVVGHLIGQQPDKIISARSSRFANNVVFVGIGRTERGGSNTSDAMPWSLGYLYRVARSKLYVGVDFAGEGTSLNNTSGNTNVVEQGLSANLLMGRHLRLGSHWRAGVGLLFGARRTGESCPDSYLGYQCYADESPHIDWAVNYGAMVHLTFNNALIGARASGESAQLILGAAF